jgi:hypothetical protein
MKREKNISSSQFIPLSKQESEKCEDLLRRLKKEKHVEPFLKPVEWKSI